MLFIKELISLRVEDPRSLAHRAKTGRRWGSAGRTDAALPVNQAWPSEDIVARVEAAGL